MRISRKKVKTVHLRGLVPFAALLVGLFVSVGGRAERKIVAVHVGYLGNLTHAQALIGFERGDFEKAVGPGIRIQPKVFHSGSLVMEALFAGELDLAYLGPAPAINGFIRSGRKLFRIIAGSMSGGVALVVRSDLGIRRPEELEGKIIAVPGIGNSQDISCRYYFTRTLGWTLKEQGGRTFVAPIEGPDMLFLFRKKEIHAAWFPEPWVSRLAMEAGGDIILKEKKLWPGELFPTTVLIATHRFLQVKPEVAKRWLAAHVDLTRELDENREALLGSLQSALKRIVKRELPEPLLREGLNNMDFTVDPLITTLETFKGRAIALGYLPDGTSIEGLVDLTLLNEVLKERGKNPLPPPFVKGEGVSINKKGQTPLRGIDETAI